MKSILRAIFRVPPFRALRDGLLRTGAALDPQLTALRDELEWRCEQAVAALPDWSWHRLDRVFVAVRRSLRAQTLQGRPNWRKGPEYGLMVARFVGERLQAHGGVLGKTYLDLGCGAHNPFGTSAVMLLNGARETVALDLASLDRPRCAEALFDLLSWCAIFPERAMWTGEGVSVLHERLARFDAEALANGDLDRGLAGVPMRYCAADIHGPLPIPEGYAQTMGSRDVLEHFLDFPRAVDRMAAMMAPGGVACHHIDLADHRLYRDADPEDFTPEARRRRGIPPQGYHPWSFLAEADDYEDGLCNRLRAHEFRAYFKQAGFDILADEPERAPLPPGFSDRLAPRYRTLPIEELETYRITLVLRRRG